MGNKQAGSTAAKGDGNESAEQPDEMEQKSNDHASSWYHVPETTPIIIPESVRSQQHLFSQFAEVPRAGTDDEDLEDEQLARAINFSVMESIADRRSQDMEILNQMVAEALRLSELENFECQVEGSPLHSTIKPTSPEGSAVLADSVPSDNIGTIRGKASSDGTTPTELIQPSEPSGTSEPGEPSEPGRAAGHSQLLDSLTKELHCPVCLLMFRRAHTLGCGHTFCEDCLRESRSRQGNRCPLCRADIESITYSLVLDNVINSIVANESEA